MYPTPPRSSTIKSMNIARLLGLILIVSAGFLLANSLKEQLENSCPNISLTPDEALFFKDFESFIKQLKKEQKLPSQFSSIQYVKYRFHSKLASENLANHNLPIKTAPNGMNILEVDFISRPDSPNDHFILQLGLIEIKTENKIWENSENFKLLSSTTAK